MKINKVIEELNNGSSFIFVNIDVKKTIINDIDRKNSIIGSVIIRLLEQAEQGKFK